MAEVALGLRWLQEFSRCFQSLFGDTDAVQDNNPDGIYTNEIYCGFELAVCLVHSLWHWWSGQIVRHNDKQKSSRMKNSWRNFYKVSLKLWCLNHTSPFIPTWRCNQWCAVVGIREVAETALRWRHVSVFCLRFVGPWFYWVSSWLWVHWSWESWRLLKVVICLPPLFGVGGNMGIIGGGNPARRISFLYPFGRIRIIFVYARLLKNCLSWKPCD